MIFNLMLLCLKRVSYTIAYSIKKNIKLKPLQPVSPQRYLQEVILLK